MLIYFNFRLSTNLHENIQVAQKNWGVSWPRKSSGGSSYDIFNFKGTIPRYSVLKLLHLRRFLLIIFISAKDKIFKIDARSNINRILKKNAKIVLL